MIKYVEFHPSEVVAPKGRRGELGDLRPLHESMKRFGQMFPLVMSTEGVLLSGERRLMAAAVGGHPEVQVAIVETLPEAAELMAGESDELRRPMPWSERAHVCHDLITVDLPAQVNRRYAASARRGLGPSEVDYIYPHLVAIFGDTSVATIRRVMAVYRAAKPGQPYAEQAAKLLHQMDLTGKVSVAYNELVRLRGPNGEAPIVDPAAPVRISAQKAQIAAVVTTVSGATRGLGMVESVESMTPAEVRRLCGEISKSRQILRNLSLRLQEAKS